MKNQFRFEDLPEAISLIIEEINAIKCALQANHPEQPDQIMTVQQAASFLSLAKQTIYGMTCQGKIPYLKRGKHVYFQKDDLLNYLKAGRRKSYQELKEEGRSK